VKPATAITTLLLGAGALSIGFACGSATRARPVAPQRAASPPGAGGGLLARLSAGGAGLFGRSYGGTAYGGGIYGGALYGGAYWGDEDAGAPYDEYELGYGGLGYAGALYGAGGYGGTRYGNYYFDASTVGVGQRGAPSPYATGYYATEVRHGGSIVGHVSWPHPPRVPQVLAQKPARPGCADSIPNDSVVTDARGNVANAVVYLEDIRRGRSGIAAASPRYGYRFDYGAQYGRKLQLGGVVETRDCRFWPHVQLVAPRGAVLKLSNADGAPRRVRARRWSENSRDLVFSSTVASRAAPRSVRLDREGFIELRSLEEGELTNAWVVVQAHPYYALTDGEGRFRLDDIPAGTYRLTVWHEPVVLGVDRGGRLVVSEPVLKRVKVRVRPGSATRANVALDRARAARLE